MTTSGSRGGRPEPDGGTRLSPTARTEAFSDGVFAIAITLLVLEVHVPTVTDVQRAGGLLPALLAGWTTYLSYLATFLTIGVIWLNHHSVFEKVAVVDRVLQWWNLLLLLAVSFSPFPNALVAKYLAGGVFTDSARVATAAYALVFTASTIPWFFIWGHLARRPDLLEGAFTAGYARRERRRSAVGILVYLVAAGVAIAAPLVAVILFIASAVFYAVTSGGSRVEPAARAPG